MPSIAIILTVHNRKEKTLKSLKSLYDNNFSDLQVFLTDDGCTDGTSEAVLSQYPTVKIVKGDGTLFWNRGMYKAWEEASKGKFDFYLWLNDDTYLYSDALIRMIESAEQFPSSIIVGSTNSPDNKKLLTYGGFVNGRQIAPTEICQECDNFNGNVVLIPRTVFEKVGNLDWGFSHSIGDIDYGLRARKAGFKNMIAPGFMGECASNPQPPKWMRKSVPFRERVKNLYSPLGYSIPSEFFRFNARHFGYLRAIRVFVTNHLRLIFPRY